MILDPTNQFAENLTRNCSLCGKYILEIGCGRGRVTSELARYAARVVAIDPDYSVLRQARSSIGGKNLEFQCCGGESLDFADGSFDLVVYSLSLHHLPLESMKSSLFEAARVLNREGVIIVIEPGDHGTLIEAEECFGVGDGNERAARLAAQQALKAMVEWKSSDAICFQTLFHFTGVEDFLENLLPDWRLHPKEKIADIERFLHMHRIGETIVLNADRRMNILRRG